MTSLVLGVDPGQHGALAWLTPDGALEAVEDMPNLAGAALGALLAELILECRPQRAVVEQVSAMPRQGVASTFKFGTNYGVVLGTLGALSVPVETITPSMWKRRLRLSGDKAAARQRAVELWPDHAGKFSRVKDTDRAEAALIALAAMKENANG